MKRYLLVATLLGAFAAPVLAQAGPFYIVFDKAAKKCSMVRTPPTDTE